MPVYPAGKGLLNPPTLWSFSYAWFCLNLYGFLVSKTHCNLLLLNSDELNLEKRNKEIIDFTAAHNNARQVIN